METKKRKNLLIIGIITLVIVLIGSTYAFFMYSKTLRAFTLTSNSIKAEFQSGSNSVNMAYAYPISDGFAKQNLDKLGYLDFTVKGSVSNPKEAVTYEIYLTEDSNNTLDSNFIKVYLTDDTNTEVVEPSIYNGLSAPTLNSASDGKVILTKTEPGTFESKYRIYVWIDSEYSQNEVNQTFSFKVNLYAYNDVAPVLASDTVKDTLGKEKGIIGVTNDNKAVTEDNGNIREYRYSGTDVDNYVYFNCKDMSNQTTDNCELWRIIGIFKDESGVEHLKIIKNDALINNDFAEYYTINDTTYKVWYYNYYNGRDARDETYWNYISEDSGSNDWTTAGLQYWLNTKNDANGNKGYLSYLNTGIENMIEETTYYLGNFGFYDDYYGGGYHQYYSDTTIEAYEHERGSVMCDFTFGNTYSAKFGIGENNCNVWPGNKATWKGKVGLLYMSDYGYSMADSEWNKSIVDENDNYRINFGLNYKTSWLSDMYESKDFWTMENSSDRYPEIFLLNFYIDNYFSTSNPYIRLYSVIPTLYLKNNVKITKGDGSLNSPYWLQ